MYARVVTFTAVSDLDAAVAFLRDTATPVARAQRGYGGFFASVDRAASTLRVLSLWETGPDRDASESASAKLRDDGIGQFGGHVSVERFDERVVVTNRPPEAGSALMVTRIHMDPATIDENLAHFEREIVPQIAATPGFQTLRAMVDPTTGDGSVGTAWDDRPSMEAAANAAASRRDDAERRGVTVHPGSYRELVLVDAP